MTTNRYMVMIKNLITGKTSPDGYFGYRLYKDAKARAEAWNSIPNTEAWVVDTKNK